MLSFGNMNMYERVSAKDRGKGKRLITWASAITLVIVLSATVFRKPIKQAMSKPETVPSSHHHINALSKAMTKTTTTTTSSTIAAACHGTRYPSACEAALASAVGASSKSPEELFDVSVQFAMGRAHSARAMAYNLTLSSQKPAPGRPTAMDDCLQLLDISLGQLNDVLDPTKGASPHDIKTWLSAALTNQATCSESLAGAGAFGPSDGRDAMNAQVRSLTQFISNALALHGKLTGQNGPAIGLGAGGRRRLLSDRFPTWLSAGDRKLLESSPEEIRAYAVVAKDGSGTHTTINEAIAFVSTMASDGDGDGDGGGRKVIHVKSGKYEEYVDVAPTQKKIMLMGEGKGKSVIVGSHNTADGWSTFASATVGAMGSGFIAKGLTIINDAGPSKQQAVALRVGADKAVIYECSLQGYQDTLYTHSNRQFYTKTDISGTIDFIFGNAAVVFQNCLIQPRQPVDGQEDSITSQGRSDPNQNTGISIHKCRVVGSSDLGSTPTYLGRPWQEYSRTVFMKTYLDDSINSDGWQQWSGDFALSTLYYGEYKNTGPGASTSGRVDWPGAHSSLSKDEASEFTVGEFIDGDEWLPDTGVSYTAGL